MTLLLRPNKDLRIHTHTQTHILYILCICLCQEWGIRKEESSSTAKCSGLGTSCLVNFQQPGVNYQQAVSSLTIHQLVPVHFT